jgi:flagellin-specific chaperone FliS
VSTLSSDAQIAALHEAAADALERARVARAERRPGGGGSALQQASRIFERLCQAVRLDGSEANESLVRVYDWLARSVRPEARPDQGALEEARDFARAVAEEGHQA